MIFKPDLVAKIHEGRKTQTRRLAREPKTVRRKGRVLATRPFKPVTGRVYAVQSRRGGRATLHIRVTDVRREPLHRILDPDRHDDVLAEGFKTVEEFARYWLALHDPAWPPIEQVFCPTCTLDADHESNELPTCPDCDGETEVPILPTPTDAEVLARFRARHGHKLVWVVTFLPDGDIPRFLAARPGSHRPRIGPDGHPLPPTNEEADDARGYTPNFNAALAGEEAEGVHDGWLNRFAKNGASRHTKTVTERETNARATRETLELHERRQRARAAANANHVGPAFSQAWETVRAAQRAGKQLSTVLQHVRAAEAVAYRERTPIQQGRAA